MSTPIKILLVDDHAIVRQGLRLILNNEPGLEVVGEAADTEEAVAAVTQHRPDVVVMDVHLANSDGIAASRRILETHAETKIIILSAETAPHIVNSALRNGVQGYVVKEAAGTELIRAIHTVLGGRYYLCPSIATALIKAQSFSPESVAPTLTDRDKELMRLITSGLRNKEIAIKLKLGVKSVEANRSKLMSKLGFTSAAELVRYAIREGIAQP